MKNKILTVVAIIILIGIIVVAISGFKVDFDYKNYHLVEIEIGQDFNVSDIKSITNEVFPKENLEIQKAGVYSDILVIKVTEISNEQKELLNNKVNEKYNLDNKVEDIEVNYIPSYRLRDVVKPYIIPMAIATVTIFAYMAIRFRTIGSAKVLAQTAMLVIMAELLFFAIIAGTRFAVNRLVLPVSIAIYMAVVTMLNEKFEKQKSMQIK